MVFEKVKEIVVEQLGLEGNEIRSRFFRFIPNNNWNRRGI